jgi:DNA-binding MarR family transcriptional regulator
MEERQLISRRQPDSDLRRSVIKLERKGLRLISSHAPYAERIYAEITQKFGAERLSQLFALLQELERSAQAPAKAPPSRKESLASSSKSKSRSAVRRSR